MKKFILLLVAFLSISTASFADIDCGECAPDSWTSGQMIRDYGVCQLIIDYEWRECGIAPNKKRDLKLKKVTFAGTCTMSGNTDLVVEYATKYLLNSVFEIFPSLSGQGSGEVDFSMECCWGPRDINGNPVVLSAPIATVEPCPGGECCCEAKYTVNKFVENGIEKKRYVSTKSQVSDGTGTFCGAGCEKVCDTYNTIFPGIGLAPVATEPCTSSCDSTWNTSGSNIAKKNYGSTCEVETYYQWRNCGTKVEVKFGNIKLTGNDCINLEDMLKVIIEKILSQVATQITLPYDVEVRIPTCWTIETINGVKFARKCYEDDCCVAKYHLISNGSGGAKSAQDSTVINSQFVTCSPSSTCTFTCDESHLKVEEGVTLSKLAAERIEGNLFETNSNVVPNPASESISIEIESRYEGIINLSITDVNGKVIFEKELNKTSSEISMNVNIKEFVKGTYFYSIKAGIHLIHGGKFIKE